MGSNPILSAKMAGHGCEPCPASRLSLRRRRWLGGGNILIIMGDEHVKVQGDNGRLRGSVAGAHKRERYNCRSVLRHAGQRGLPEAGRRHRYAGVLRVDGIASGRVSEKLHAFDPGLPQGLPRGRGGGRAGHMHLHHRKVLELLSDRAHSAAAAARGLSGREDSRLQLHGEHRAPGPIRPGGLRSARRRL